MSNSTPQQPDLSAPAELAASIPEAVYTYQNTMQNQSAPAPPQVPTPAAHPIEQGRDVTMLDSSIEQTPVQGAIQPGATNGLTPGFTGGASTPARIGTPSRSIGAEATSRATSVHPDAGFTVPKEAAAHGAPVRDYLNTKITQALMDGMKKVAKEQPRDPLRVLGEYLLQKSLEMGEPQL